MSLKSEARKWLKAIKIYVEKHPYYVLLAGGLLLFLVFRKNITNVITTLTRNPTSGAFDIIKKWEGFYSKSYQDTGGVWTIGYGTIQYKNGSPVAAGQTITQADALSELQYEVAEKTRFMNTYLIGITLTNNQYDALISFAYNVGLSAFKSSTLFKKIKANPNDTSIKEEFLRWSYDNGIYVQGLNNRRQDEAKLYFS
ncbi:MULTISPECIES: lysozyme [Chitinophagaceae]